jgi:hypothetical protein
MASLHQLLAPALVALFSLCMPQADAADTAARADFKHERASTDAAQVADWVVRSDDHRGLPFMIVDKKAAMVYVFDARGQLSGSTSALLGAAIGDDSVPGIGERKISSILPAERTTPAGRFVAALARNIHGKEILWIDYDAAVSLHRVVTSNRTERRAERLASATPLDNRISYGCINVPAVFFDAIVLSAFKNNGIVYVLPEVKPLRQVFASYAAGTAAMLIDEAPEARATARATLAEPSAHPG